MAIGRLERGVTHCGGQEFRWGARTYVMSIVNVTPDSFSGDGLGDDVAAAVAQARRAVEDGADIVDVGGESTRPGHTPVAAAEELARVLPVVQQLARAVSVPISIDTFKPEVARQALAAGAHLINDVWGVRPVPDMVRVAAEHGVPIVLMHNQMHTNYGDVVADVIAALRGAIERALAAGVRWENIIVDPGIGFGKTWEHNLELQHRLHELGVLGRPVLLGTSRKSTIGQVLSLPAHERVEGTAATVAIGIARGTDIVRVHDTRYMVRVCRMSDAIVRRSAPAV